MVDAPPSDAAPPELSSPDAGTDAAPLLVACGSCLADACVPTLLACARAPTCQRVFQCAASSCLASGSLDPACLIACAQVDVAGGAAALQIVQCVTQTCGPVCEALTSTAAGRDR